MSHTPKFYIIQEGDGGPDVLHVFDTQPERDAATINLIFGEDITTQDEAEQWDKMREELNDKGRLSFEGDPGLQWFSAIPDDSFAALARWKEEALAVEAQWDCQAVGKLLDVTLGHHIRPHIEPGIIKLIAQRDRARLLMEVALLRFTRWSLRKGEHHPMPRVGDYPPAVQSIMDKMRTFLEQPASSNQAAADWFGPVIMQLRALPVGALDAEFEMVLRRYFSHPGAEFPVEVRMALESVRDTAIAMKDSLKVLPPTGGSVLLIEAPERLRATACGALEKMR